MNHSNQTNDTVFSCYSESVVVYRYFAVLWGCIVTVTGTVGNLMTVLAFTLDLRLRTRFNVLIINLAVADLLYCTVLQPISVDSYLHLRWRSGQLWCTIFGLLLFLSNSVSIITLCLIAVSRYLLVAKRAVFDYVFSSWGIVILLISAWALGLGSFAPLWSAYVFVPQVCTCSFHRIRGRPYSTILLFLYFIVGLSCVGVFYMLIYRQVRNASKALLRYRLSRRSSKRKPTFPAQETTDSVVESTTEKSCGSEISSKNEMRQNGDAGTRNTSAQSSVPGVVASAPSSNSASSGDDVEFKRVTHMCFAVFLCFVFCYVPFVLLNTVDKNARAPIVLHMVCANLTWLNSCINPVLYALMNRQFRQAYRELLTRAAAPLTSLCNW